MFRLVAQLENLCLPQPTTTNDKVNNKRNLLAVILLLVMPTAEAQIENIRLVDDSTLVLDRVYAGMLGANNFSIDSVYRTGFVGFRVGASAKLRALTEWLRRSFGDPPYWDLPAGAASD